jgi:hypothetical protein
MSEGEMGSSTGQLKLLTRSELDVVTRALELSLPPDAVLEGVWWPGVTNARRNYRLTMSSQRAGQAPLRATWIIEREANVYRLRARPPEVHEILMLLEALREVEAIPPGNAPRIAEASYDCVEHTYELSFTLIEDLREGGSKKRWILRRHRDARPLSVGYLLDTLRGGKLATLSSGATLRGSPWSD